MLTRHRRHAVSAAFGATCALATLLAACYPDITDSRSGDTVTTLRAPEGQFATALTYMLPDSVVHIVAEGEEDDITHAADVAILSAIRQNMNARGYTEETNPAVNTPDFAVTAAATTTTNIAYYYYNWWAYWGWYPYWPGYAPGWGWYYPGYVPVAYAYETGTVLISLIDLRISGDQRIAVTWIAGLNGLLASGAETARITEGVNQAFEQSPYVRSSPSAAASRQR